MSGGRRRWAPIVAGALVVGMSVGGFALGTGLSDDKAETVQAGVQVEPDASGTISTGPTTTTMFPVTMTTPPTAVAVAPPAAPLASRPILVPVASLVSIKGIGPVLVGMTVSEAARAAGRDMLEDGGNPDTSCFYTVPEGLEDISFMVTDGTIARVDVYEPGFTTKSGIGVGSTEEDVWRTYPGHITEEPHTYHEGSYLIYSPLDARDQGFAVVFEVADGVVTRFRGGRTPEVYAVEGCF